MATMKRILSAFLALVLTIGMMPTPVLAFETEPATEPTMVQETVAPTAETEESIPETTAVETTVAVTEAEETVSAETVPVETEIPETVPAETAAAETLPEETIPEETIPEETVSETVPEERIPQEYDNNFWYFTEEVYTWTENVAVVEYNEDGSYRKYDTTETHTESFKLQRGNRSRSQASSTDQRDTTYAVASFSELKAMIDMDYIGTFLYAGTGSLTIEENLYIPENVVLRFYEDNSSLTIPLNVKLECAGSIYVDDVTVKGEFIVLSQSGNYVTVNKSLTVSNYLEVDGFLCINSEAAVTGMDNIVCPGVWEPRWDYGKISTVQELREIVSYAANDTGDWLYRVQMSTDDGKIVIDRDLTLGSNMEVFCHGSNSLVIESGASLIADCFYLSIDSPLEVNGTLENYCDGTILFNSVSFAGDDSFIATEPVYLSQNAGYSKWSDMLTGVTDADVSVTELASGYFWCVMPLGSMPRLGTPTNLTWNMRVIHKDGRVSIVNAPGELYWKTGTPDNDSAVVCIYDYTTDDLVYKTNCQFGGQSTKDRSLDAFFEADPPSGTYYFTVTSVPRNGAQYHESLPAVSAPWTYTQPGRVMSRCTGLKIDWPYCTWTDPAMATANSTHQVQFYYSSTQNGTPIEKGMNSGTVGNSIQIWTDTINSCGKGWYSFRVRAVPDNITNYRLGDWSEMSPAFYYDPARFSYDENWILNHRMDHPHDPKLKLTFTDVPIVLKNDFTVPEDMVLDIAQTGSITVPAGKTLTLNCSQASLYNGGKLIVEEGGTLIVNTFIFMYAEGGHIENRGTIIFNDGFGITDCNEDGMLGGTTSGVPLEYVTQIFHLGSESNSYRNTYLELFASGEYGHAELYIHGNMSLPDGYTIPANATILVWRNAELTVNAGETLTVDGVLLTIENGSLRNWGDIKIHGILEVHSNAYNHGTVNMLENTHETGAAWLGVMETGSFYNYEAVNVNPWATVYVDGKWYGNPPNNMGGDVHGSGLSMTQAEFAAEVKAAKAANEEYVLERSVEITRSMTLDYQVTIGKNATVSVYKGATLTVNDGLILQDGADLLIHEGAKLKNNSYIMSHATSEAYGTLGVDGTYIHGNNAAVYIMQSNATPAYYGIEQQYLTARYEHANEEDLLEALKLEDYGAIQVWTDCLELNTDIIIPANMTLIINPTWSDLENGTRYDWVKINSDVTVYGALNPNAYFNGTPCNLEITGNGNIEVMPGGNMYTCGNVLNFGRVHIHTGAYFEFNESFGAEWEENDPIIDMTETDLRTRIKNGETYINLFNAITLTKNLVLPENVSLTICEDGELIVPNGITLTMDGRNYIDGGQLTVEAGGTFKLNNDLHIYDKAVVDVQGKILFGNNWSFICRKYDGGWDAVTVNGVSKSRQAVNVFFREADSDTWGDAADVVENNSYGRTNMMVVDGGEITMPRSMTLPNKTILRVDSEDTTFVIPEGMTLTNNGNLQIMPTNKLVNYGTIKNYCYIPVYGQLDNHGTINCYAAVSDSQFTNEWSTIAVLPDYGESYFNNRGIINVYPLAEVFAVSNWNGDDPVDKGGEIIIGRYQPNQDGLNLAAGKSVSLTVQDMLTFKNLTSREVTWNLPEEYAPFATLTGNGKLAAQQISEAVTVKAIAVINATGEEIVTELHLVPSVTQLEITDNTGAMVNDKTVPVNVSDTETVFKLQLHPMDLDSNDLKNNWVTWTISDKKNRSGEYAYAEDYRIENGVLTVCNPTGQTGTVTVKVACTMGAKKNATFKLNFGTFATSVEVLNQETQLSSGSKLQLKAEVKPANVTKAGVTWKLEDPADKTYVNLTASGVLTAKKVYGEYKVSVIAVTKDGLESEPYTITILPEDTGILVLKNGTDHVTKSTLNVDLNTVESLTITAENFTGGIPAGITWKSSKPAVAQIAENGGPVHILTKGSATITATAPDGRKATVTLKISQMATDVTISGPSEVASGKSVKLTAELKQAASKKVTWSIVEGDEYAKISTSGKLTANKDITAKKTVIIRATAADGSGKSKTYTVYVRPLAQSVQITSSNMAMGINSGEDREFFSNITVELPFVKGYAGTMEAWVYPYRGQNHDYNAIQSVTWKSSNPKAVQIDQDGDVTILNTGTVTITATANDGSGKKASFKLKIVN